MTRNAASRIAEGRALKNRRDYYVVWSPEDGDQPGSHYQVSTRDELDTYFSGARVEDSYGPD